jgi:putative hydroxymethylpyrimidine transport system substrate-binding protein
MKGLSQMIRTRRKVALTMAMLFGVAIIATACSDNSSSTGAVASGSTSAAPATLDVELDWVPNPDHVGLFYAQDNGYYSDAGLTVNFRQPSNAADPIKLVALGKVDLAITYEPEMFYGQESELPAVAVATVVPVPLNSLIVNPDEPITDLSEMNGKSVGVTGIPSDGAFYQTMLKTAGLSTDQTPSVNVGFNLVPSVLSNKVDAIIGGYQNVEAIQIEQESGTKPSVFPADQLGVPSYAELEIAANGERLQSDAAYADAVRRFVAAVIKGTDDAIADPDGATAMMKQDSDYKPEFLDESVPYTLKLLAPASGTKTGCIDVENWQSYGDWMSSNDLITSTPDAAAIATTDYMPYSCA